MIVSLIAAYTADNRVIGRDGGLPWHLPRDLGRFRELTMGHTLLMGRRTLHSLKGRRLAGRRIIVLSRSMESPPPNADELCTSIEEGLKAARDKFNETELFVAGGAQVYRRTLEEDLIDRMYLTIVHADIDGDTFFPEFDPEGWREVSATEHPADESHPYPLSFLTLERVEASGNPIQS